MVDHGITKPPAPLHYDVFSRTTGFMLCFSYTNAVVQLIFLTFLHRFTQKLICLSANVFNFEY